MRPTCPSRSDRLESAPRPVSPSSGSARIPQLDGIRGLAILMILLWHCLAGYLDLSRQWSLWVLRVLNLAWTGVDLFFVLSGFLIGGIMLDYGRARNFLPVFYLRRALRIVPIYYLLLLSFVLARWAGLPERYPELSRFFAPGPPLAAYFGFLQNFFFAAAGHGGPEWLSVTWSLAVEEQFYLCLPFVIFLVPRRRLAGVLIGLVLATPLLRIMLFDLPPRPGYADYLLMPARADSLLLGVLGAWLVRQPHLRSWLEQHRPAVYGALGLLAAGVLALHQAYISYIALAMMAGGYTWIALFYWGLILTAVTEHRGPVAWLTRLRPLRDLGRISYCVYLIHLVVPPLAHAVLLRQAPALRTWTDAAVTAGAVAATLGLAALSWRFFESRLVAWGHSFQYRFDPTTQPDRAGQPAPTWASAPTSTSDPKGTAT